MGAATSIQRRPSGLSEPAFAQTCRGRPPISREAVVELIASTTTWVGLTVRCELDTRDYPTGIRVSDAEMKTLNIKGDTFHPEWEYTIWPARPEAVEFWASP